MPVNNTVNGGTSNVQILSFLFKGIFVAFSPVCGWGILKLIIFVFTNPQYFLFTWLVALAIGLVAEFFTETWRPSSHLITSSRTSHVQRNPVPTQFQEKEETSNPNNTSSGLNSEQNQQNITENGSPTLLFKSQIVTATTSGEHGSETKEGLESSTDIDGIPPLVQLEAKMKIESSAKQIQAAVRSRSSSAAKGYGKPVLFRMDCQLESQYKSRNGTPSKEATPKLSPLEAIASSAKGERSRQSTGLGSPEEIDKNDFIFKPSEEEEDEELNREETQRKDASLRNATAKILAELALRYLDEDLVVKSTNNEADIFTDANENEEDDDVAEEVEKRAGQQEMKPQDQTASKEWGIFSVFGSSQNKKNVPVELAVEAIEAAKEEVFEEDEDDLWL